MPEILVIAPQQEIADIVAEMNLPRGEVGTVHARMEQGVAVALAAVASGARVLVSRGLTQRMIADALPDIPCVEIKVSGYDVLRAYLQATAIGGQIAVIDRREVIDGFSSNVTFVKEATNFGQDFTDSSFSKTRQYGGIPFGHRLARAASRNR